MRPHSNPTELRMEETDLQALLSSRLAPLALRAARDNVEVRVETTGETPAVAVDRAQLAACVATLVGNALCSVRGLRHIEPGARIVVRIARDASVPDAVGISIADDGPGLPNGNQVPPLEPHPGVVRSDELAMAWICEVVAAHGGSVEVRTSRGRNAHGTIITLHLPLLGARTTRLP